MITMLLEDTNIRELNEEDTTTLVRVLLASVKKAVGEKIVPTTEHRKTHSLTKSQKVCCQLHLYALLIGDRWGCFHVKLYDSVTIVIPPGILL